MTIIDINTMFGPHPAAAADLSVDELLQLMQTHGIAMSCTASTVGVLVDHSAGNSASKAACTEQPKLLPTATVNPQSFYGGDGPHARFKSDGFKLVRFFPAYQRWSVNYAPFVELCETLAKDNLPMMVEVGVTGDPSSLMRALPKMDAPIILSGVDHTTLAEGIALMRKHPHVHVETSCILATGAIKHVVDCVGVERVLYGSGAPARPMASGLGVLRSAGLTDEQLSAALGGNAKRLLGI